MSAPRDTTVVSGRWSVAMALVSTAAGLVLFVWAVRRWGTADVLEGVRRVGAGFLGIVAIAGARYVLRSLAWRLCIPRTAHVRLKDALAAVLAGDALGNATPLGVFASEPAKAILIRSHLRATQAASSLILENGLYSFSVLLLLATGAATLLVTEVLPPPVQRAAVILLATVGTIVLGAMVIVWKWPRIGHGVPTAGASRWVRKLREVVGEVRRHIRTRPGQVARVLALDLAFHALAVTEVFVTLELILGARSPSFLQAFLLETVNRFTLVLFKFVPLRVGVDEAGSGMMAGIVALDPATGVALAVIRKARTFVWMLVGLAVLVVRGGRRAIAPAPPTSASVR